MSVRFQPKKPGPKIDDVVNCEHIKEMRRFGIEPSVSTLLAPHMAKNVNFKSKRVISTPLEKFKRRFKLTNVDDTIFSVVDLFYSKGFNPILAGGKLISYLNGDDFAKSAVSDYDLFFVGSEDVMKVTHAVFNGDFPELEILVTLPYVVELLYKKDDIAIKIQLVRKTHCNIEHVIESFDIRGCAVAYCKGDVYWVQGALKDIKNKKIVALSPRKDFKVFNRITKYCNKGWTLDVPDALIFSACAVDGVLENFNKHNWSFERLDVLTNRDSEFARATDYQDDEAPLVDEYEVDPQVARQRPRRNRLDINRLWDVPTEEFRHLRNPAGEVGLGTLNVTGGVGVNFTQLTDFVREYTAQYTPPRDLLMFDYEAPLNIERARERLGLTLQAGPGRGIIAPPAITIDTAGAMVDAT